MSSGFAAQMKAELLAVVQDSEGKPVPDAEVMIFYRQNASIAALDGYIDGVTDSRGQWRGSITYDRGNVSELYAQVEAYSPYWASERLQARLPQSPAELVEISFAMPLTLSTYRVTAQGPDGVGAPGIAVWSERPFFNSKLTDVSGVAQFRYPEGMKFEGYAFHGGLRKAISIMPQAGEPISELTLAVPFVNAEQGAAPANNQLSAVMLTYEGRILPSQEFEVSPPLPAIVIKSDSFGFIRMRGIPYKYINVSWMRDGYRYVQLIDVSAPMQEIRQPSLLRISPPSIASLGEGCYKVQVIASDPRPLSTPQVSAKQGNESAKIYFNLDQEIALGAGTVSFSRILCVQEDTSFDVTAGNRFENNTVKIQLRKYVAPAEAAPSSAPMPAAQETKGTEDSRLEIVVLLLLLLSTLAFIYIVLHFRGHAIYVWQSLTRFVNSWYRATRGRGRKSIIYGADAKGADILKAPKHGGPGNPEREAPAMPGRAQPEPEKSEPAAPEKTSEKEGA